MQVAAGPDEGGFLSVQVFVFSLDSSTLPDMSLTHDSCPVKFLCLFIPLLILSVFTPLSKKSYQYNPSLKG